MPDYPLLWQIEGRLCVVVGGGRVGSRKVRGLAEAGARIRLIDPQPSLPESALAALDWVPRPYRRGDLKGAALAFAATGSRTANARVAADARRGGIPVNVADSPAESDFTLPALLRRGGLTVSVATAGGSPALAALLRDRLTELVGPEWAVMLELAAAIRQKRLTLQGNCQYNLTILRGLVVDGLPDLLASGDRAGADQLLRTRLGESCSLAELGISLPKAK